MYPVCRRATWKCTNGSIQIETAFLFYLTGFLVSREFLLEVKIVAFCFLHLSHEYHYLCCVVICVPIVSLGLIEIGKSLQLQQYACSDRGYLSEQL